MTRALLVRLALLVAGTAAAQERAIPFWPDSVPAAIRAEVDGNGALETVRELSRFHRVHGSPGYAAAAEHVRAKAAAAGLSDAKIERFPADGKTRYAHFLSYPGWNAVSASLEEVSPTAGLVASFPALPVALADYSQDADITAELVDVGAGTSAKDYEGRPVSGKIVLADGALPRVHRLACEEHGAAGFLSDFPNQTTAWSGDDRDLVRWGHLSPYQRANRFAFMLSKRQAEGYRRRLAAGEKIVLRARVRAKIVDATYDVVSATIPGTDSSAPEILFTAHLCHESAGANDNASGSAAILEAGRAIAAAIARGTLPRPRHTLRFLWTPEIAGSQAWLVRHPELVRKIAAGIHMDMVGGLLSTTKSTFHLSRTAESLPHVASVIAAAWLEHVVDASTHYAERGGDPWAGLVWPGGSREPFLGDMRRLEMGSDHVFEEASFAIPMVYFHDWPDVTIHTNKDQPENLDATKLGRVAYMGAGIAWTLAALPQAETGALLDFARARVNAEIATARTRRGDPADAPLRAARAYESASRTLRTLADLWPVSLLPPSSAEVSLTQMLAPRTPADPRVPVRNPEVRGPVDVYYFSRISDVLGSDPPATALSRRDDADVLAYEALNLVDGRRTVSEIRDVLAGAYRSVPVAEIAEYLDLLARAKTIMWK